MFTKKFLNIELIKKLSFFRLELPLVQNSSVADLVIMLQNLVIMFFMNVKN